jgi:hypothetical protein
LRPGSFSLQRESLSLSLCRSLSIYLFLTLYLYLYLYLNLSLYTPGGNGNEGKKPCFSLVFGPAFEKRTAIFLRVCTGKHPGSTGKLFESRAELTGYLTKTRRARSVAAEEPSGFLSVFCRVVTKNWKKISGLHRKKRGKCAVFHRDPQVFHRDFNRDVGTAPCRPRLP